MFLYDFVLVKAPPGRVAAALGADPTSRLSRAAERARSENLPGPASAGHLRVGAPRGRGDGLVVPFSWSLDGPPRTFSTLDGDLELNPLDRDTTHMSVRASCDPPPEAHTSRAESERLRRMIERVLRELLNDLADDLANPPTPATAAVAGGHAPA